MFLDSTISGDVQVDVAGVYTDAVIKTVYLKETFYFKVRKLKRFDRSLKPTEILVKIQKLFNVVMLDWDEGVLAKPDDDTYMYVHITSSSAVVHVSSRNVDAPLDEYIKKIASLLPEKPRDTTVTFTFWAGRGSYPQSYRKNLVVPTWESIKENYTESVRDSMQKLVVHRHSQVSPRIIVLHGDSGTGKTYAIRSLAHAWGNWASIEYITDPINLFNDSSYMMNIINEEDDESGFIHSENISDTARLLIVEDCGTLLSPEASVEMEQALSNVLNLANGLLGQSYGVYLLFTTNNKVKERHPAIMRNGRLLADIEFAPLNADEAAAWAKKRGVDVPYKSDTLANLYAKTEQEKIVSKPVQKAMGFR